VSLLHVAPCKAPHCEILHGQPGRCGRCDGTGQMSESPCEACIRMRGVTQKCGPCRYGKEKCAQCGGTGKARSGPCDTCNSKREVECKDCNERGDVRVRCKDCRGTKRIQPPSMRAGQYCNNCDQGWRSGRCGPCAGTKWRECDACSTGKPCDGCEQGLTGDLCKECEGTGRRAVRCNVPTCTDGTRKARPCSTCHKKGFCRRCAGTGQASEAPSENTPLPPATTPPR
jgi:hypothetical protein